MPQPEYQDDGVRLYFGDCIEVMRAMPKCSVDTIITDPPYHLTQASRNGSSRKPGTGPFGRVNIGERGFMGKTWDGGGIAFDPKMWATALRVAKPGAMLLAFGGTRTFHRLTCAIEDAGWEIRDCLMWLYGSGFPKSHNVGNHVDRRQGCPNRGHAIASGSKFHPTTGEARAPGEHLPKYEGRTPEGKIWEGWGTALKPAWEPIILAMKPLDGTFATNAQKHGVAGLNIDGGRIEYEISGTLASNPSLRRSVKGGNGGHIIATESKNREMIPHAKGRWPANLIHDGSDEVVRLFPDRKTTWVSPKHANNRSGDFLGALKHPGQQGFNDSGSAARFFYCAKSSRSERTSNGRLENKHPTVKPLKLMEYLCKLTATPTGGVVLDPFAGSGTTLLAAKNVGRGCIGIEIDPGYVKIATHRLKSLIKHSGKGGAARSLAA